MNRLSQTSLAAKTLEEAGEAPQGTLRRIEVTVEREIVTYLQRNGVEGEKLEPVVEGEALRSLKERP